MPQLDALRAFAVAAVIYSHWLPNDYHLGLPLGAAGVQLFFVLSGFLISGILLRCRQFGNPWVTLKAFYARRFLRIFPLYYLVLLTAFIFNVTPIRETFVWHVTYLSNLYFFLYHKSHGPFIHFWSLAVEEQFYLVWPTVLLFVPKRFLLAAVLGLISIGVLSQSLLLFLFPDTLIFGVLPNSNFDALGLGALIALAQQRPVLSKLFPFAVIGIPLFAIAFALRMLEYRLPFHGKIEHYFMLLSFTWLVSQALRGFAGPVGVVLTLPPLLYLGRISYGLYIIHNFAPVAVGTISAAVGCSSFRFGVSIVLMATLTLVAACLSWHLFEAPLNALKRYFPYSAKPTNRRNASDANADRQPTTA